MASFALLLSLVFLTSKDIHAFRPVSFPTSSGKSVAAAELYLHGRRAGSVLVSRTDDGCPVSGTALRSSVIRADEKDFEFDVGQGGVRLAMESAIKITGTVKHKPGSAQPGVTELVRYTDIKEVSDEDVQETLGKAGAAVLCTGIGKELYKDPGETMEEEITLAPFDAVRDALFGAAAAIDSDRVVINFLGGDDLQVLEVLDAMKELVLMLDVNTKCKISFNSMCHGSFPATSATVTVITLPLESSVGEMTGVEKAVASGEVYFRDGKWWTVVEEDINTAVA